jgi:SAM-dependent methyltransferase
MGAVRGRSSGLEGDQSMHHHGSDTAGTEVIDWDTLGPLMEQGAALHSPLYEQAARWLGEVMPRRPARVLDVGSGPGVGCCVLAHAFPDAEVVAVDGTPALLERTLARAERQGVAGRVRAHIADLPDGLDALEPADLIWISQVLHHLGDQLAAVDRLRRLLRPGGLIAVAEGGLPTRFLPRDIGVGRPGLHARLDAAAEDWFIRMRAALPGARETVEDWPGLLAAGGLTPVASRTFLLDLPAPLGAEGRDYLHRDLARQRDTYGDSLAPDDLATLDRLLDPADEAGLLRRPDVYLLTAKTVHTARAEG